MLDPVSCDTTDTLVRGRLFAAVFALCGTVQLGGAALAWPLRYQRDAILGGEAWRLLTAHLVHLGWAHWALNMGGLAVCLLLDTSTIGRQGAVRWGWRFAALCGGVGVLLLALSPRIVSYVGLSGVVYGLFVLALWPRARRGDWIGWAGLVIVLGRMALQLLVGTSADEEARIGGRIIAQAHLYGVMTAAAVLAVDALVRSRRRRVTGA